ncbi:phospho-N-acetylmuramoyl-pentapeptide-transferase [Spirulina subsalsa]|uniref:phospho-N-acetylmuramoyl-pentapeptide- transferase n=1 Tax=Spirulina TaxID=1154 RepID=UPI003A8D1AF8
MDAKLESRTSLRNPSGKVLLLLLAVLVGGMGLSYDAIAGNLGQWQQSLLLPMLVCAVGSAVLGQGLIPILRRLKASQIIQEDGPKTHLKKVGTPTMGGLSFVPLVVAVAWLWSGFDGNAIAVGTITLFYALLGWVDDWEILRRKSNKGLTPRMKLVWQISGAIAFCLWMGQTQPADITTISLSAGWVLPLGIVFWPIAVFVFAAESNATNITDGVDGLASGTAAIALLGLAILIAPTYPTLALFCACFSGGCLGFVVHNHNPARVFMGDTGSLALGGTLAAVGLLSHSLWGLFILSGLFFVESISVIAQVGYYKATKGPDGKGKRLLKMAPIHHHLELSGWSETQIVGVFYLSCFAMTLLAFLIT